MASPWGWGNDETTSVSNFYSTFIAGGPTGAPGPAGASLGFTQNDRQGRASIQTSADAENTNPTIINTANALTFLNNLTTKYYTTDVGGAPPYRSVVTQESILDTLQKYAGGLDELGPFEVDGLASGTGTIELESAFGLTTAAIQGLGFRPTEAGLQGELYGQRSLTYTGASGYTTISQTGVYAVNTGSAFFGDPFNVGSCGLGVASYPLPSDPLSLTGTVMSLQADQVNGGQVLGMTFPYEAGFQLNVGNDGDQGKGSLRLGGGVGKGNPYFLADPTQIVLKNTANDSAITSNYIGGDGTEARLALSIGGDDTVILQANGEYGAGQILIGNGSKIAITADGNEGLIVNDNAETPIFHAHTALAQVSVDNALFSVARFVQPTGQYTITAAEVAKAFIIAINDVSSPVDVTLPIAVPSGTLIVVKKETSSNTHQITISVDTGGTIDGNSSVTLTGSQYNKQGFYYASGTQWYTF